MSTCASLYSSLSEFLSKIRDDFEEIEEQAKATLPNVDYRTVLRRQRRRKRQENDGDAPDALDGLSPKDKFRIKSFIPILDTLDTNLRKRSTVYRDVSETFSFLADISCSKEEIQQHVKLLMEIYPEDVNFDLTDELLHFHMYVKQNYTSTEELPQSHADLYRIIHTEKIQTAFPNVEAILRLFLCLMVTNCSGERSFSKLKRIKNELRSTMSQDRLSALSILSIESDKIRDINFNELLDDFAMSKSRIFFLVLLWVLNNVYFLFIKMY